MSKQLLRAWTDVNHGDLQPFPHAELRESADMFLAVLGEDLAKHSLQKATSIPEDMARPDQDPGHAWSRAAASSEPRARCRAGSCAPPRLRPGSASLWPETIHLAFSARCPTPLSRQPGSSSWLLVLCHRHQSTQHSNTLPKTSEEGTVVCWLFHLKAGS